MIDASESIERCAAYYGDQADAMRQYLRDGEQAALQLDNRGPIVFAEDGTLDASIRAAYSRYGFYVFTGVLEQRELADLEADLSAMRGRFPTGPDSAVNAEGEPALGADCKAMSLVWSKPLGDPCLLYTSDAADE